MLSTFLSCLVVGNFVSGSYFNLLYLIPVLLITFWYMRRHARLERRSIAALKAATEAGMLEPPTLHPEIDPTICIGCKSMYRLQVLRLGLPGTGRACSTWHDRQESMAGWTVGLHWAWCV